MINFLLRSDQTLLTFFSLWLSTSKTQNTYTLLWSYVQVLDQMWHFLMWILIMHINALAFVLHGLCCLTPPVYYQCWVWGLEAANVFGHKYAYSKKAFSHLDNPFSATSTGFSIYLELCTGNRIKKKKCLEVVTFRSSRLSCKMDIHEPVSGLSRIFFFN